MAFGRSNFARLSQASAVMLVFAAADARADVGAHVGTRLAHTDNVALAQEGAEESSSIAEVTTGINFARNEPRLDTVVAYQVQGVFYQDAHDANEVFHTLNATTDLAIVPERLALDVFANYDQTIVDPTHKYSFNKLALTGNRTDVALLGAGPRIDFPVGANATAQIRYLDTRVDYDDPTLGDGIERVATFVLGNSESRNGTSWTLSYDRQHYDYEFSTEVDYETFVADLGYWVTPSVRLFTNQGLESDYTAVLTGQSPGLDDHYWYLGVDWRPNDRTTLLVSRGERSFGRATRFRWNYQSPLGGLNLEYVEEPNSSLRDQIGSVRRAGGYSPVDILDGPNGNPFYLQKGLRFGFVLQRARSTVAIRAFDDRRFDIVEATNDVEHQTELYRGSELALLWRINTATSIGASSQLARRRSTRNAVNDEIRNVSLNLARQIGRLTELSVNVSRETSTTEGGGFSYTENQAIVGIQRRFGLGSSAGVPQRFTGAINAAP